jgi:hypothetical protein
MKIRKRKLMMFTLMILTLFIFCACSVTVDIGGAKYTITIRNDIVVNVTISINEGASSVILAPEGQIILELMEETTLSVYCTGEPGNKFAVDNITGNYIFTLDGDGYTLHAEYGTVNYFVLRVTQVS